MNFEQVNLKKNSNNYGTKLIPLDQKIHKLYSVKMKLFESVLKKCVNLGISPEQSRLNGKLLLALSSYWLDNTLNCIFCVREVSSFSEMANSIFITAGTTTVSVCFTIFVIKKTKIFGLVDDAEKIIERGTHFKMIFKTFFVLNSNIKI